MLNDIKIVNGVVFDPYDRTRAVRDLNIRNGRIVDDDIEAKQVIDADGCLVLPGLIEGHAHIFYGAVSACISPDVIMLPSGVTTTVDCGTSGYANYEVFHRTTIVNSLSNIKVFLNLIPAGMVNEVGLEDPDPRYFSAEKIKEILSDILGKL